MCVYGAPPTNINNFPAPQLSRTPIHTTTSNNKQNYKTTKRRGKRENVCTRTHHPNQPSAISYWQTYFSVFYLCFQLGAGHIYDNKLKLQAAKTQPRFVGVGLFKAEMRVFRCCQDRIKYRNRTRSLCGTPTTLKTFISFTYFLHLVWQLACVVCLPYLYYYYYMCTTSLTLAVLTFCVTHVVRFTFI